MANKTKSRKRRCPARKNRLMRRFERTLPREALAPALAGSGDLRAQRLLELMLDPAYRQLTLAKLAERVGLNLTQLIDVFRRHQLDVAIMTGCQHLPELVEDMALAARNKDRSCPRCDGLTATEFPGEEPTATRVCPECDGKGKILKPGDKEARRDFLDVMGVRGSNATQLKPQINRPAPERHEDLVTVASKLNDE